MKEFFDRVRHDFGSLSQSQVDGFNVLLNASKAKSVRHKAYILATAWHETAQTMQPIAEYGKGMGKPYGKPAGQFGKIYYGRGYVQLTWLDNYKKAGLATGRDLVSDPELAMRPDIAAEIIVRGMSDGWFTGKKLEDQSYTEMRRIVNGTDRAATLAIYAEKFQKALEAVPVAAQTTPADTAPHVPPVAETPTTASGGLLALILRIIAAIFGKQTAP